MGTIARPLPSNDLQDVVDEWYSAYIMNLEETTLYDLAKASNYMDIEPLQDLACARVASLIRGKEPHEIRKILGLSEEQPASQTTTES